MKYVRTKDGIGEVVYVVEGNTRTEIDGSVTAWTEYVVKYKHKKWNVRLSEQDSASAKLSDRLEDLFDEQIVEYNKNGKTIRREFVNHIYYSETPEGEPEYYGAFRTKTGLRYVAKEIEGEWRLI